MRQPSAKKLSVGLVGPGLIGKTLLAQIEQVQSQKAGLSSADPLTIELVAVANSTKMVLDGQNAIT